MIFAYPSVAWLLPAVALPIVFHLFFRLRRQLQDFPSLMFFLRIDPRLSAKRKIHEWLILALRCLFIATLLFALLRPLLGLKGAGGHVARLVLIDNSGSMAGPGVDGTSKLTLAARATEKLIESTRAGDSTAAQLMIPDEGAGLPGDFSGSPAALRDALGKLGPSDGAASVPKAIRRALATLATARAPQHELHIITDVQRDNWSRGEIEAEASDSAVIVHRLASAAPRGGSVSLQLAEKMGRSIPAGRVTPVRFILQNHGPVAAHVQLNATDDSGKNFSREMEVAAGDSARATLTFSFQGAGFHWAHAWIQGDTAPAGTASYFGFWCTDVRTMLFLGDRQDFAALPNAVSPGGTSDLSGIFADFLNPQQSADAFAKSTPLAVATTWEHWPQDPAITQALEQYVRQGGTLFLVPVPDAGAAVPPPAAPWLGANLGATQTVAAKVEEPILLLRDGDAIWHDLRDAEGRPKLGTLRAFRYRPLRLAGDWQVLASSAKGDALLARKNLDRGQIFVSGLAFTPQWSSLPLKAGFVVLVQNALFGHQNDEVPVKSINAADEFLPDSPFAALEVKSLTGDALAWQGKGREFPGFPRAGVFEIRQPNTTTWVDASANAAEAVSDFLPSAPIPLLRNLPHRVADLRSPNDMLQFQSSSTTGRSLYRWLLLFALILLLLETRLANERSSDLGLKLFHALKASNFVKGPAPKTARQPSRI